MADDIPPQEQSSVGQPVAPQPVAPVVPTPAAPAPQPQPVVAAPAALQPIAPGYIQLAIPQGGIVGLQPAGIPAHKDPAKLAMAKPLTVTAVMVAMEVACRNTTPETVAPTIKELTDMGLDHLSAELLLLWWPGFNMGEKITKTAQFIIVLRGAIRARPIRKVLPAVEKPKAAPVKLVPTPRAEPKPKPIPAPPPVNDFAKPIGKAPIIIRRIGIDGKDIPLPKTEAETVRDVLRDGGMNAHVISDPDKGGAK